MKCSSKEWDTCEVEKRGCDGCYYNLGSEVKNVSEEIEERLKEIYDFQEIEVEKMSQYFIIMISLEYKKGFTFRYFYQINLTIDANIERISALIDKSLIEFYRKRGDKHGNKSISM